MEQAGFPARQETVGLVGRDRPRPQYFTSGTVKSGGVRVSPIAGKKLAERYLGGRHCITFIEGAWIAARQLQSGFDSVPVLRFRCNELPPAFQKFAKGVSRHYQTTCVSRNLWISADCRVGMVDCLSEKLFCLLVAVSFLRQDFCQTHKRPRKQGLIFGRQSLTIAQSALSIDGASPGALGFAFAPGLTVEPPKLDLFSRFVPLVVEVVRKAAQQVLPERD
jgi:hypothetical protein